MRDWEEVKKMCDAASEGPWEVLRMSVIGRTIKHSDFEFASRARLLLPEAVNTIAELWKEVQELRGKVKMLDDTKKAEVKNVGKKT